MTFKTLIMTGLIALPTFTATLHGHASSTTLEFQKDYDTPWCRNASSILRASLTAAYSAETFEQEVQILKSAIIKTLDTLNPKFTYYLETSLILALKLESNVSTAKSKALLLRRNIQNALDDMEFIDNRFSSRYSQDHGTYVRKVLNRVLNEGLRSQTVVTEIQILGAGIESAIQILNESDYARNATHACAVKYLKEASEYENVFYKRDLISRAINSLTNGCY